MSDMDPLYELMKDSAEDMSRAAVEMNGMMTVDENTDVNIEGYGAKPSFSKQIKSLFAGRSEGVLRLYPTLAAAQADIANIPEGSTTYVRSTDDTALAVEYINNGGTLEATGRAMPSQKSIDEKISTGNDARLAFLFEDNNGNSSARVLQTGEWQFSYADMRYAWAKILQFGTLQLDSGKDGVLLYSEDKAGHQNLRVMEDGRWLIPPTLRAVKNGELISDSVGRIEFGAGINVSKKGSRGIKITAGGGDGAGVSGKLSSTYQGMAKLTDASTWVDRALAITAGTALSEGVSGSASVFGFHVIKTDRIESPRASYYAYYSTDHASGEGGCYLAISDSPMGPWTPQGRVYYDASATQTETPCVVWDRFDQVWRMFYQVQKAKYGGGDSISAVGSQSTLCATSSDGVNWTKDPYFILDYTAATYGDGHTGYFYVAETPDGYVGRSALGGGTYGLTTLWQHNGGSLGGRITNGVIYNNWYTDYRDVGSNYEALIGTDYEGRRAIPFAGFGYTLNGVRMAIGQMWYRRSGTENADVIVCAGPVTEDYRRFIGAPIPIWTPEESWESEDVRFTNAFFDTDYVYIYLSMSVGQAAGAAANRVGVIRHAI